ncbi:hypothetical protein F4815DRAFT_442017 [Daldinia loculata]|nr:hypothetical protein F4815DRAFT_442017 [Daldinia loculata]
MACTCSNGFIKSLAGGSKFTSTFVIDDIQYHFSGNINPSVQDFVCDRATLQYGSLGELTTQRQCEGKIGTQNIELTIKNGPTIKGPLNSPIDPATRVSGMGTWAQN